MPMHSSTTTPRDGRSSRPSTIRVDDDDDDDDNLDSHLVLGRTGSAAPFSRAGHSVRVAPPTSHSRISFIGKPAILAISRDASARLITIRVVRFSRRSGLDGPPCSESHVPRGSIFSFSLFLDKSKNN
jgi:hypothetical protein